MEQAGTQAVWSWGRLCKALVSTSAILFPAAASESREFSGISAQSKEGKSWKRSDDTSLGSNAGLR